ncbi:MAG: hypothetical protein QOF13_1820 [Solirubrobacterales bacterium]|nr:hypothetical protein [Solirubrobacterales bacterium]
MRTPHEWMAYLGIVCRRVVALSGGLMRTYVRYGLLEVLKARSQAAFLTESPGPSPSLACPPLPRRTPAADRGTRPMKSVPKPFWVAVKRISRRRRASVESDLNRPKQISARPRFAVVCRGSDRRRLSRRHLGFAWFPLCGTGTRYRKARRRNVRVLKRTTTALECRKTRAGATGLEPATSGVTGRRSNQLSYAPENARTGQRGAARSEI